MEFKIPASEATAAAVRPWGIFGSMLVAVASIAVQYAVAVLVVLLWHLGQPGGFTRLESLSPLDPSVWLGTVVAVPFQVGVLALAIRQRGPLCDYLALTWPGTRAFVTALGCMAVLLVASDGLTYLLGREIVPAFMTNAYQAARSGGMLPALWLAVIVAAPAWEEILFRGFLFTGFLHSALGAIGTILITSLIWAIIHVQYDLYNVVQIFAIGLLFGWLRLRYRSTLLTVVLHALTNFIAMIQAMVVVEWMR